MKNTIKLSQLLTIASAISIASSSKIEDPKLNYAIAKNLKRIKPHIEDYQEENNIRIKAFAEKNENGEAKIVDDKYVFGSNKDKADEEYNKLINKEIEIEFYTFQRNEASDKLPINVLSELIDIIITE